MKKKIIIFIAAVITFIGSTGYHGGAAADGAINRTGAKGTTVGCAGVGCHTGTAPVCIASIFVDSAGGIPVTKYTPGKTYTIRAIGKHSANDEFGFQMAVVSGSGTSQVQAGSFGTSLPANVSKITLSGLDLIEHNDHISAVASGDSFVVSIPWTAPSTAVGNITVYLSANAVNGNHMADAADVSGSTNVVLLPNSTTTNIGNVSKNASIDAFPNPCTDKLTVRLNQLATPQQLKVYDIFGRCIYMPDHENMGMIHVINTADWAQGMYLLVIENNGSSSETRIVKQ
jgi:hypothetical protein